MQANKRHVKATNKDNEQTKKSLFIVPCFVEWQIKSKNWWKGRWLSSPSRNYVRKIALENQNEHSTKAQMKGDRQYSHIDKQPETETETDADTKSTKKRQSNTTKNIFKKKWPNTQRVSRVTLLVAVLRSKFWSVSVHHKSWQRAASDQFEICFFLLQE